MGLGTMGMTMAYGPSNEKEGLFNFTKVRAIV